MLGDAQPAWSDRPSRNQAIPNHDIIRSGRKHGLDLTVIALGPIVGANTHWRGQTVPCLLPKYQCPPCLDGLERRWFGYFAAWWVKQKRKVCCEITATPFPAFEEYIKNHGSLRGAEVRLFRADSKPNGLLVAQLAPYDVSKYGGTLPDDFDVRECLSRTWRYQRHIADAVLVNPDDSKVDYTAALRQFEQREALLPGPHTNGNREAVRRVKGGA